MRKYECISGILNLKRIKSSSSPSIFAIFDKLIQNSSGLVMLLYGQWEQHGERGQRDDTEQERTEQPMKATETSTHCAGTAASYDHSNVQSAKTSKQITDNQSNISALQEQQSTAQLHHSDVERHVSILQQHHIILKLHHSIAAQLGDQNSRA